MLSNDCISFVLNSILLHDINYIDNIQIENISFIFYKCWFYVFVPSFGWKKCVQSIKSTRSVVMWNAFEKNYFTEAILCKCSGKVQATLPHLCIHLTPAIDRFSLLFQNPKHFEKVLKSLKFNFDSHRQM